MKATPPIITIGVPKSGNHLLLKFIGLLTGNTTVAGSHEFVRGYGQALDQQDLDTRQVLAGQLLYNPDNIELMMQHNFRPIYMMRDPRDQTVSRAHWIRGHEHDHYPAQMLDCPVADTISYLIANQFDNVVDTDTNYRKLIGWVQHPFVYRTSFEALVGSKGGGSNTLQIREADNIARHLGIRYPRRNRLKAAKELFGQSFTFYKGKIGAWKTEFTDQHKDLFKQTTGQLLIDLGYEKDNDW